ncbi:AMP-binding protein [Albimonas sp. CAU 1670]|uniref:class I adenylate-forming enzyme family protein n=1 Tax=Albimonas sp. CAU 1670 TaxID=3032599 RepID=UPI0023DBF645|nr:AMP-binding protein [Albimonas sp. CAU 1670]MDF2233629.1 AMP-binding protein [Albimonas sp. CAU 1670]
MDRALGKMLPGSLLATAAIRRGERTAVVDVGTGRRATYAEVDARANRLANALGAAGFAKGDVLAFLVSNRTEIVEIYFALSRAGIVGVPLNYRLAPPELDGLMEAMGARGLIYEDRFAAAAGACRHGRDLRIRVGEADGDASARLYEEVLAQGAPTPPTVEVEESDPFYFNLTSGTTGLPKSYLLSQYNNATLAPMFIGFDCSPRDVMMTVFPAFGRVGFAWIGAAAVYGVPNVLMNFEPAAVLRAIEAEGVTILNLVPTMAAMLLTAQDDVQADLSSLRAVVFAGSSLPEPIRRATEARLCPHVYEYYGMQETGALVASTPEDRRRAPGSVGRAVLFAEVRVVDDAGRDLPVGETGEIIGRSPNATTAYWQNPEKTAETFRNGWIHTGDLGSIDAEGYLTIRGRKKDMIVTGGQNVHAAEVEEVLLDHPAVQDAAVFALPHEMWGEAVTALIVARPGSVDAAALEAHCRARMAGFKTPKRFLFDTEALPRTPTGKVQKFLLVERFSVPESADG